MEDQEEALNGEARTDCIPWSDHFHHDTNRIGCSPG